MRISLALAVSALLALTGQGLAMSRGVSASVGQMVICTGTGPVVVYVDAEGQPTRPPHYCPDKAMSLLGALELVEVEPSVAPPPVSAPPVSLELVLVRVQPGHALARAPPFVA
ncbi:hypothetical protein [Ruegeria hyattellae]|uniref:hypothetical protein n=1 Tax=Ruegeria hyattellae TaxID=3233337 RepID=UPI00355C0302